MVEAFLRISDKGISQLTDERGLHIFYAGNYTEHKQAVTLLEDIVSKGIKDAFVVALKDGKRVPIE
jgi:hypothetical protein